MHLIAPQGKTLPPSKHLAKQPPQEPTRALSTPLSWRARGTERGSLKDSRTSLNTVEAPNRPQKTILLFLDPLVT
jgi:hypothetical protein